MTFTFRAITECSGRFTKEITETAQTLYINPVLFHLPFSMWNIRTVFSLLCEHFYSNPIPLSNKYFKCLRSSGDFQTLCSQTSECSSKLSIKKYGPSSSLTLHDIAFQLTGVKKTNENERRSNDCHLISLQDPSHVSESVSETTCLRPMGLTSSTHVINSLIPLMPAEASTACVSIIRASPSPLWQTDWINSKHRPPVRKRTQMSAYTHPILLHNLAGYAQRGSSTQTETLATLYCTLSLLRS